jgi:hypothetical protein
MSFSSYFRRFLCVACSFDSEVFGLKFVAGNHGSLPRASLCLILTPKLRVRPPIEGYWLGPRVLVGLGGDSIPGDLGCLRTQVLGHSIP